MHRIVSVIILFLCLGIILFLCLGIILQFFVFGGVFGVTSESASGDHTADTCRTQDFPVLMYHHIRDYAALDDPAARNLSVSPAELRSQMQYIRDQNYRVITTEDIHDGTVPCRSIMLTFDDGYADIYSDAFPILQEYDFRGIVGVIIAYMDEPGYLTGGDIRSLQEHGWEIASHTWTHSFLTRTPIARFPHEIMESKQVLEDWFHIRVNTFIYPGGYYGPETLRSVQNAGYSYAFSARGGQATLTSPYEMKRINMLPGITPEKLGQLIESAKQPQ